MTISLPVQLILIKAKGCRKNQPSGKNIKYYLAKIACGRFSWKVRRLLFLYKREQANQAPNQARNAHIRRFTRESPRRRRQQTQNQHTEKCASETEGMTEHQRSTHGHATATHNNNNKPVSSSSNNNKLQNSWGMHWGSNALVRSTQRRGASEEKNPPTVPSA